MASGNLKSDKGFSLACMYCHSFNIKVFSPDDNDFFGLNPKYECRACGKVGMPVELPDKKGKV